MGHDITMISRQFEGLANDETVNGVRHIRVPSRDAPKNKLFYRIWDVIYALAVRRILPQADVTITNSVSMPLIIPKSKAGKIVVNVARFPKGQMWMYKGADRLQAVSTHVEKAVKEQSPSVAHLTTTIPVNIGVAFAEAIEADRGSRERTILFVGRIAREKGIGILIDAFRLVHKTAPDWRLKIVGPHKASEGGDGEELLSELKAAAGNAAPNIDFVGPVFDEQKLIDIYKRADIFVYPSIAEKGEAFGLAPVEAMACGCAVIVSSLECFTDYLINDVNGLSFDHTRDGPSSLAEVLGKLVMSQELRDALAAKGIETSKEYTPKRVAQLYIDDFNALLSAK